MTCRTDTTCTPGSAVNTWWACVQAGDWATLEQLLLPDFVSSGGPNGRTVSREQFLAEAREIIGGGMRIDDWRVGDMEIRHHGHVVICAYSWWERGSHDGSAFEMSGEATDVLVRDRDGWRHQAHHVGLVQPRPC